MRISGEGLQVFRHEGPVTVDTLCRALQVLRARGVNVRELALLQDGAGRTATWLEIRYEAEAPLDTALRHSLRGAGHGP